jgi:hypothetical protein
LFLSGALVAVQPARAEVDPVCIASYETAQRTRMAKELDASRAQLALCISACPEAVSNECKQWLREIEETSGRFVPTLQPKDARFSLRVDGGPAPLEGVTLAPGDHSFTLEAEGFLPRTERFHVTAGQVYGPEITLEPEGSVPALAVALGSVGVATLLVSGVLAIVGHVDASELRATCAPRCASAEVEAVDDLWTASGAAAAAGGALAIGAGVWIGLSVSPPSSNNPTALGIRVVF